MIEPLSEKVHKRLRYSKRFYDEQDVKEAVEKLRRKDVVGDDIIREIFGEFK